MVNDRELSEAAWAYPPHARARMQQRGITPRMIRVALGYGERAWSHGRICHRVTDRCLCGTAYAAESDRLRGLCVVQERGGTIVTVKWDFRLRRRGPLRRSNRARWAALRRAAEADRLPAALTASEPGRHALAA